MKCFNLVLLMITSLLTISATTNAQERPTGVQLFPEDTVLLIQTRSVPNLIERFQKTSIGMMLNDEKLAPIVESLYGSAADGFQENITEFLGVSLDDLTNLPKGEVSFGLVAPKRDDLAVMFIFDVGEDDETMETLIAKALEEVTKNGGTKETEMEGETEIVSLAGDGDDPIHYFERKGTLVACSNIELLRTTIQRWDGTEEKRTRTLAQNRKFLNVMSRCKGAKNDPPQIKFFVDPIGIFKGATRGDASAGIYMGVVRLMGLDGLSAIGASMSMAPKNFDYVFHAHVSLANPRAGVVRAIAIKNGDVTPEDWVPYDVTQYVTGNWDFDLMYNEIEKIYNSYYGEDAFLELVDEQVNERLELLLKEDLVDNLDGRFSLATFYAEKEKINGQSNLLSINLKEGHDFEEKIESLLEKFDTSENFKKKSYKGMKYWTFSTADAADRRREARASRLSDSPEDKERAKRIQEAQERREQMSTAIRFPEPTFGIYENHLMVADSEKSLKMAVKTGKGSEDRLASDPEFERVVKEIRRQLDGKEPGLITYNRPEESFRMLYDLADSDDTRSMLEGMSESSGFMGAIFKALDENELPEFDDLLKYFSPGGGMLTNDSTGMHYMAFSLRREE